MKRGNATFCSRKYHVETFKREENFHFTVRTTPHFGGTYETMNGWQLFISVSDSNVAANGYESSAWLLKPGTSSEYSYHKTFCFDSTKTFSFPRPHSSPRSKFVYPQFGGILEAFAVPDSPRVDFILIMNTFKGDRSKHLFR